MTDEEAMNLCRGDKVLFHNEIWKVDCVCRQRHRFETQVEIKIHKGNDVFFAATPDMLGVYR